MVAALLPLQPFLRPSAEALYNYAAARGWNPVITSVFRSRAQQGRIYRSRVRQRRRGIATLPAAPPGQSFHQYGRAFDMVTTPLEKVRDLGTIWIQAGGRWHLSDPVHFEA